MKKPQRRRQQAQQRHQRTVARRRQVTVRLAILWELQREREEKRQSKPRQNRLCWVSHPLTEHRLARQQMGCQLGQVAGRPPALSITRRLAVFKVIQVQTHTWRMVLVEELPFDI
jgi:hypothetical protein